VRRLKNGVSIFSKAGGGGVARAAWGVAPRQALQRRALAARHRDTSRERLKRECKGEPHEQRHTIHLCANDIHCVKEFDTRKAGCDSVCGIACFDFWLDLRENRGARDEQMPHR
jgi:hypothetical protein